MKKWIQKKCSHEINKIKKNREIITDAEISISLASIVYLLNLSWMTIYWFLKRKTEVHGEKAINPSLHIRSKCKTQIFYDTQIIYN